MSDTRMEWVALPLDESEAWQQRAFCREIDTELFFPEVGGDARPAKRICNGWTTRSGQVRPPCEVRDECLADAFRTGDKYGIRGGLSERERQKLRRSQGSPAAA